MQTNKCTIRTLMTWWTTSCNLNKKERKIRSKQRSVRLKQRLLVTTLKPSLLEKISHRTSNLNLSVINKLHSNMRNQWMERINSSSRQLRRRERRNLLLRQQQIQFKSKTTVNRLFKRRKERKQGLPPVWKLLLQTSDPLQVWRISLLASVMTLRNGLSPPLQSHLT